jgi:cyanophycinase
MAAYQAGAVIAGSSAGAMVLCDNYYNPPADEVVAGLGLISPACVLPHHNTFGRQWASRLAQRLPHSILLGIDEQTGMLDDGPNGAWRVYGRGVVTLYRGGQPLVYAASQVFEL